MNKIRNIITVISLAFFMLIAVGSGGEDSVVTDVSPLETASIKENDAWIGTFEGRCGGYNMKNEWGEEIVIFDNYISMPEIDYKFTIYDDNTCSIYTYAGELGDYECHNVGYHVSSNYEGFSLTMMPVTGSDCCGNEIVLTVDNGSYKIVDGALGQPSYRVNKTR